MPNCRDKNQLAAQQFQIGIQQWIRSRGLHCRGYAVPPRNARVHTEVAAVLTLMQGDWAHHERYGTPVE